MSRRAVTTLTVELRIRLPPGTNAPQLLGFISSALLDHKTRVNVSNPIAAIDLDSFRPRITRRETQYL